MPQTRRGVFPVLLPLLIIVPVAAALAVFAVAAWHARESGQAALRAARDELRLGARGIEAAAKAREQAAALLAASPALRAWAAGTGEVTEEGRGDMAGTSSLFPRPAGVAASRAADGALARQGPDESADDNGTVRAAAELRLEGRTVGEVALEGTAADLAGEAGLDAADNTVVAVTDGVGRILHLSGAAVAGARTISDIFPRIERKIFISAMEAPSASAGMRVFDDAVGGVPVVIAAARLPVADWRLFVAVPRAQGAPVLLLAGLAVIAAAALAGLLVWTGVAAGRLRQAHAEEMEHEHWKLREARAGLEECAHLAHEAEEAVARAADSSRRAAADTDGAAAAVGEARPLVAETGALLGDRTVRLARAASAATEAARLAESAGRAAADAGAAASRAEDELARAIPAAGSASRAAARIKSRVAAIGSLAERARLLSLNAAVDAARGEDGAKKLLRAVEEIQGLAGRAAESARGLSAECAAAAADAEAAQAGAEEAGRASHAARQGAEQAAQAALAMGKSTDGILSEASGEDEAPAGDVASLPDRAGSALLGIERICARIAAALGDSGSAAAEAARKCGQVARAGQAGADGE